MKGHHLLVLELVGGATLADRLRQGALAVDEALCIAREIAAALEAAHERGIVHRDLKPGNIALTLDGSVKVLDFGLAKATGDRGVHQPDLVDSPTITSPLNLTELGVILGTAAYMSPEQAKGAVADKRSEVWAFGCVLYEMLAGRRAVPGGDVPDILAAVLRAEPDWGRLPTSLSPAVRALLEGSLEKDRRKRIADISAARFVLDRAPALTGWMAEQRPPQRAWRPAVFVLGAAVAGAATAVVMREPPPDPIVTRFTIHLPQGQVLTQSRRTLGISPDGRLIAYVADNQLFVRSISGFDPRPLAGGDSGTRLQPTFSPDGRSLAFYHDGWLKRQSLTGGSPAAVAPVSPAAPFTINWSEDGILFTEIDKGISRLPPNGGSRTTLVPFVEVDGLTQGIGLLPDGDTLLFTQGGTTASPSNFWDSGRIVAQSLKSGERTVLVEGGSNPRYVPTGHLLYMVEGTLMAVPFDASRRKVVGTAMRVVAGVRRIAPTAGGEGQFDVSATGTLAYMPGPPRAGQETIIVYDADGTPDVLGLARGTHSHPRVSPDGQWLAFESHDGRESWISVYHLSGRTAAQRLTFGGRNRFPTWTGDGERVVFQSDREGDLALFWQPVSGGPAERLTRPDSGTAHVPESWVRRKNVLLFRISKGSTHALWMLSLPDRQMSPLGVTSDPFPTNAVSSPDGRWIAYQAGSFGTGEARTYVQPFPATGAKYEIAPGGRPAWSTDGKRLFFVPAPGQFMAVSVTTGDLFAFTTPESLPRRFGLAPPAEPRTYDVLPDGRIVGINALPEPGETTLSQIHVVQNWFEELKAKVPPAR